MSSCRAITCNQCTIQINHVAQDFEKEGFVSAEPNFNVTKQHEVVALFQHLLEESSISVSGGGTAGEAIVSQCFSNDFQKLLDELRGRRVGGTVFLLNEGSAAHNGFETLVFGGVDDDGFTMNN
jgi:hypothetical protein